MLHKRSLQSAINAVVIILLIGTAVVAAVGSIPLKSPLVLLIAKVSSNPKKTSAMLSSLDPKAIGKAIQDNPEFLVEVMKYSDPSGTAIAVNENPDWVSAVSYTHLRAHETRHDLVC